MSQETDGVRPRVVYLGGFGRSGSTLLERMLGAVPGWTNVGELVDLARSVYPDDEVCGCGERFSGCPFWQRVGDVAFGGWNAAHLARLAALRGVVARQRQVPALLGLARGRRSGLGSAVAEYQLDYGRIYRAVAEVSGARTVVDASKGPAHGLALGLRAGSDPGDDPAYDLVIVNLVRDPRGVAYSWSRRAHERPQAGADGGSRGRMWSPGVSRSAAQWAALQSELAAIGRLSGIRVVRVRYEDLVAAPYGALTALLHELGDRPGPAELSHVSDHAVTLAPSHGLSGNPGRFRHGTLQLAADDAWRREMPAAERRLVTAATLPWLVRYGYSRPGSTDPASSTTARKTA
ncbi:MAG: sulfotransferase [Nocardioides sp.]